ncbi:MAG: transcription repressor NadR [Clostridia bacterium]
MKELNGEERRIKVLNLIKNSNSPLNGTAISKKMGVSRQVIVSDIALLRANKYDIISTNRGYIMGEVSNEACDDKDIFTRVFKVEHSDDEIYEELSCIISLSGQVLDVFVDHEVYGKFFANLNIATTKDIENFVTQMQQNELVPLKNITSNCHFHTVQAPSVKLLDIIELELAQKGFLKVDN